MSRQIFFDTETTGLDPSQGHKIIEIGCIELIDRKYTGNNFHSYINPLREIDEQAMKVHGITQEFLQEKPIFADIAKEFLAYIQDAELIAHNAKFDIGFLNYELALLEKYIGRIVKVDEEYQVTDSLALAKELHPGQRNSLDALCKRYDVDNTSRELHGALLDSKLLAEVYLAMTGGQSILNFDDYTDSINLNTAYNKVESLVNNKKTDNNIKYKIKIVKACQDELKIHSDFIEKYIK